MYDTIISVQQFSSTAYARKTYQAVVKRLINAGTTTCAYYGTLHLGNFQFLTFELSLRLTKRTDATKVLADVVHRAGQRALIGKCNMDRNGAIDYVEKSASISISETKELIHHIRTNCCSPTLASNPTSLSTLSIDTSERRLSNAASDSSRYEQQRFNTTG